MFVWVGVDLFLQTQQLTACVCADCVHVWVERVSMWMYVWVGVDLLFQSQQLTEVCVCACVSVRKRVWVFKSNQHTQGPAQQKKRKKERYLLNDFFRASWVCACLLLGVLDQVVQGLRAAREADLSHSEKGSKKEHA